MVGSRTLARLAVATTSLLVTQFVGVPGTTEAAPPPDVAVRVPATGPSSTTPTPPPRAYDEFIVKFRKKSAAGSTVSGRDDALEATGDEVGVALDAERTLATGATLVEAGRPLGAPGQERLIDELESRPDVLYAAPNEIVYPTDEPTDPDYATEQWHYGEDGARLPPAWSFSTGLGVVVAVIDTGRTTHPDLNGAMVTGYDFISDAARARDGDGRDGDPSDEGDWQAAGECSGSPDAEDSSWHGTHVAGTIGARWNSIGGAGVAPSVRIQPLRVLGRCGGETSDIVDAVVWAAGGDVRGVPQNLSHPRVINMSLGPYGAGSGCNPAFESAAEFAVSNGTSVVVAAGNNDLDTRTGTYASCHDVVVVGATDQQGARSVWDAAQHSASNHGSEVDVSAPGTAVWSTLNDGTQTPGNPTYRRYNGTSMATPHVAGLIALVESAYPSMTPGQIEAALKSSARPLSDGCSDCGAGIIDAARLFASLAGPVTPNSGLNSMFNGYANGSGYAEMCDDWSGGDGTQSIPLPSGKRAWFFSDSYLGDYRLRYDAFSTSGLRNAIVVQNGSSLRTITGGGTCQEKRTDIDFWDRYAKTPVRESGSGFYWGADGMVSGGNVVKFWWRNVATSDGFWQETNTAVTVQPLSAFDGSVSSPTPQLMPAVTPYANHPILWGISLLEDDGWVYVYGSASMDSTKARKLFLARTTKADLASFGSWQFRTAGGGWSGAQSDAAPVSSTFEPTMSYSVKKLHGTYWLFQREPGLNGGDIVAHPATKPWSFTNKAVTLYSAPEGNHGASDYLLHYDVRVHDGITSDPDDLVLSYNVNTTAVSIGCRSLNDLDGSIYRPRFITVPAEKLDVYAAKPVVDGSSSGYSSPGVVTSGVDNQWYDSWAYASHCPPLVKSTTLTATTDPDGDVHLAWNHYGRNMWYWLESRDATAGTAWKRSDFWMTLPTFDTNPITSAGVNGHTFQYRVVPYANGFGGQEAPTSNAVSVVARVVPPSAPTGVTVSTPSPKNGTATVRWATVTYPHAHNFYRVFYWDKTAGQTEATAPSTGWLGETATWTTLTLKKGHSYGFDVQAQNIAGNGARSANVAATP